MRIRDEGASGRAAACASLHRAGELRARALLEAVPGLSERTLTQTAGLLASTRLLAAAFDAAGGPHHELICTRVGEDTLPSPELLVDAFARLLFSSSLLATGELDAHEDELLRDACYALQDQLARLTGISPTQLADTAVGAEADWRRWLDAPDITSSEHDEVPLRWATPSARTSRPGICVVEAVPDRTPFALLRAGGRVLARSDRHVLLALSDLPEELVDVCTPRPGRLGGGAALRAALVCSPPSPAEAELALSLHLASPGLAPALELARCALSLPASGPGLPPQARWRS